MNKFVLYYTHNSLPIEMEDFFQRKLRQSVGDIPIVSVFKNARTEFSSTFGSINIHCNYPKNNWDSIHIQMRMGIEAIINIDKNAIIYLAEHDVLYPPSYFNYVPEDEMVFLKNKNLYFVTKNGYIGPHNTSIHSQTIGSCKLFNFCINEKVTNNVYKFKTHSGYKSNLFNSIDPCLDVRHGFNYTGNREPKTSLPIIPFWGHYTKIINNIPKFKYT